MAAVNPNPPIIVIRARRGWTTVSLRELLQYRELLFFFIWRDLKVRYKQTAFGALWAIVQPLGLMLVLTLVLGRVPHLANTTIPYPVFVLSGIVPWNLVSQGLLRASTSLVSSSNMLQKVYFPRLLLPIAAIGVNLVDFALALGILFVIMLASGYVPGLAVLWLIPLTGLGALVALAGGVWTSAVNVRFRDVNAALPFLVQVWLFASPIAYTVDLVPGGFHTLYQLNPMVGVIEGFRWALFQQSDPPVLAMASALAIALVVLATGLVYFARVERTFADVI